MAETFLFNIADRVLGKLGSLALQEVCLACGVVSEQEKLNNTLSAIRAVLLDAEEKQATNHQITDWLRKIKDALYDADDVLDEFQYEALRTQVQDRRGITRKVRNFFSRSNPLAFGLKMGQRIKGIREKLDEIAAEKSKYHLTERLVDLRVVHGDREMTHSFVRPSDVIGRDDDKENIVGLLMPSDDAENFSVIPIVGIGGLGKTTLAKLVYNDERVVGHFELKMWICVSEDFNFTRLTKEIIESATGGSCNDLTIDQLQSRLRRTLANKKFLLVLDDMWNDDRGKWIELQNLLMSGANGSKLVVTTRNQSVASIMGPICPYSLKGLPHEECLSLFVKWAFREGEVRRYPNLLKIGEDIVKKCGGVPLAIRTLGSLLYLKTNEHDWMFIKNNEIWKLEQKDNDILPALKLSYDAMPSYLKQCFSYCSIFPKDCLFNCRRLIPMWIAQGLIQSSNENQELEDIGQQYFKELWSRSFFQDVEEATWGFRFKMHDLIHDLALLMAQSECLIVNCYTQIVSKGVRHVSFLDNDLLEEGIPRFSFRPDNLRTIICPINGIGPTNNSIVETCISKFQYLRVLDFSNSSFEVLPTSIGNLRHLRYLDISRNRNIKQLPNSICKLHNLQTLYVYRCDKLEELPKDYGNLISLRNLMLTTRQAILQDEGIGCLNALRYLFILDCNSLQFLGEGMQRLTAIRTLVIWNCQSLEESLLRCMRNLTALETLEIWNCGKLNLMESEEDIQGLTLRLRWLDIGNLPHLVALPQWIQGTASTLQNLHIQNCENLMSLPEWLQNHTSLQKLSIIGCPKLSALPIGMQCLTALTELNIAYCPQLSKSCERETGEDWPKIAHVQEITLDHKKIKSIYM